MTDKCCVCGKEGFYFRGIDKPRLYFGCVRTAVIIKGNEEISKHSQGLFCHKHYKQFKKIAHEISAGIVHQRLSVLVDDAEKEFGSNKFIENFKSYLKKSEEVSE